MTASIAAISQPRHGRMMIDGGTDIAVAAGLGHVPIGLGEIPLAGCDYPMVLIKDGATGGFRLVALLGFNAGCNLFVMGENWLATYLPHNILRLPFCLGAPDGENVVACIDETSALLNEQRGTALFDADGGETAFLTGRRALMDRMQKDAEAATGFVSAIVAARIVRPMTLTLHFEDLRQQDIEGTYTIDPLALEDLPEEILLNLHRSGYIGAVYALIHSLGQVNRLEQLHNARGDSRIIASTTQLHL